MDFVRHLQRLLPGVGISVGLDSELRESSRVSERATVGLAIVKRQV